MDCFGNVIELGDRFFYGTPDANVGNVIDIKKTTIRIEIRAGRLNRNNSIMNCKSPRNGVCLDKIPERDDYETPRSTSED